MTGHFARRTCLLAASALLAGGLTCSLLLGGCGGGRDATTGTPAARLDGRLVLPADTFAGDGPVGAALDTTVNGRKLPLAQVPVQGFSSLLVQGDELLALQDNGLGTLANSADSPLRWYRLRPDWNAGTMTVVATVELRDPDRLLPWAPAGSERLRKAGLLSGADLDPEAMVVLPDGTLWIADEFGPSLVHVSAAGVVLDKPALLAVPPVLRAFARGAPYLRTPDHPDFRALRSDVSRRDLANLPRSGGVEGLALSQDGRTIYAAVEKGLPDDPDGARRLIMEFDPARRNASGRCWFYHASAANVSLSSLESDGHGGLLVLERDPGEGRQALVKRVYRVVPDVVDENGFLAKALVCDLLALEDDRGLTHRERGAVGLGRDFSLPHVTPECLVRLDDTTLLVANDNNYPFSSGRRAGKPDDTEIVRLKLATPLDATGAATLVAAPARKSPAGASGQ